MDDERENNERDETYEVQTQILADQQEQFDEEARHRRQQVQRAFLRLYGTIDQDLGSRLTFRTGDEPPKIDQKQVTALPGDLMLLTGRNLAGVRRVMIGDVEAKELTVSDEEITFILPYEASSDQISVVWDRVELPRARKELSAFEITTARSDDGKQAVESRR